MPTANLIAPVASALSLLASLLTGGCAHASTPDTVAQAPAQPVAVAVPVAAEPERGAVGSVEDDDDTDDDDTTDDDTDDDDSDDGEPDDDDTDDDETAIRGGVVGALREQAEFGMIGLLNSGGAVSGILAGPAGPEVTPALPIVSAAVHQPVVSQGLARTVPGMRRCYATGLSTNTSLRGTVRFTFAIGPDGKARNVSSGRGLSHRQTDECLRSTLNGLSFPTLDKQFLLVTYPVTFSPSAVP